MEDNLETAKKIVLCFLIIMVFLPSLAGLPYATFFGPLFFFPMALFVLIWLPRLFLLTIKDFNLGFKYSLYTVGFLLLINMLAVIKAGVEYLIKVNKKKKKSKK
tara:strand:- start:5809 stop:6120 length:312 start_codon:yes stop_codon:yes gene_type:complete